MRSRRGDETPTSSGRAIGNACACDCVSDGACARDWACEGTVPGAPAARMESEKRSGSVRRTRWWEVSCAAMVRTAYSRRDSTVLSGVELYARRAGVCSEVRHPVTGKEPHHGRSRHAKEMRAPHLFV